MAESRHTAILLAQNLDDHSQEILNTLLEIRMVLLLEGFISEADTGRFLTSMRKSHSFFDGLLLVDKNYRILQADPPRLRNLGSLIGTTDLKRKTEEAPLGYWSGVFLPQGSSQPAGVLAVPFQEGFLLAVLNFQKVIRMVFSLKVKEDLYIDVLDQDGMYLVSQNRERQFTQIGDFDAVRKTIEAGKTTVFNDFDGTVYATHLLPLSRLHWIMLYTVATDQIYQTIRLTMRLLVALFLGLILLWLFMLVRFQKGLNRNLGNFNFHLQCISDGDYEKTTPRSRFKEISDFWNGFDQVRERIKDRERRIRESEEKYQELFNNTNSGVFVYETLGDGRDFRLQAINKAGVKLDPRPEEAFLGKLLFDAFPEAKADRFDEKLRQVHLTGLPIRHPIVREKDGRLLRWLENFIFRLSTGEIVCVTDDLTEQKKADLALTELNAALEKKVTERTVGLEAANAELVGANRKLETTLVELQTAQKQLVESEKLAVLGRLAAGLAHEINTPLAAITTSNNNIQHVSAQTIRKLPLILATLSKEEVALFFLFLDTARTNPALEAPSTLRKTRLSLQAQLQAKGIDRDEGLADDLAELGFQEISDRFLPLFQDAQGLELVRIVYQLESFDRSLKIISEATKMAARFIGALRTYAVSGLTGKVQMIDLRERIEMALLLYYHRYKESVEIVRDYEAVPLVSCVPDRLDQVWSNILNNAFHAMNYKGRLGIALKREGSRIRISFSDTGPGIPASIRERLFVPFSSTKDEGEGRGLGLYIVKKILDEHRGDIELETGPGGTKVSVLVPIVL